MTLHIAELLFNDSSSKHNKNLTDFLERNLQTIIVNGNMRFQFTITKAKDLRKLRDSGITRLPAMVIKQQHYIGVPTIIQELHNMIKNNKQIAAPKSEDEVLQEYFSNALETKLDENGKHVVPDDEEIDESNARMSRLNKEVERRNLSVRIKDDDDKEHQQPKAVKQLSNHGKQPTRKINARPNNIDDDDANDANDINNRSKNDINNSGGDAIDVLTKMKPAHDPRDDTMMRQLLEKMGDDML